MRSKSSKPGPRRVPPPKTYSRLVLVLESIQCSNPTYWSASNREPPRSTIGSAAVRTDLEYEYEEIRCEARTTVVTNAAGDHDSKGYQRTGGGFGAPLCSYVFSYSYSATRYSYSYSIRSSIAIRPIGLQFLANRLDQRSASPPFQHPSSTSTVRRGGLSTASLSTSTKKSDARHEQAIRDSSWKARSEPPTLLRKQYQRFSC